MNRILVATGQQLNSLFTFHLDRSDRSPGPINHFTRWINNFTRSLS